MSTPFLSSAPAVSGPLLLDAHEVAAVLGCSARHVQRLANSGSLPPPIHVGRLRRWRRAEIQQWVEAGCPANSDAEADASDSVL